jgi:hypothetical protein
LLPCDGCWYFLRQIRCLIDEEILRDTEIKFKSVRNIVSSQMSKLMLYLSDLDEETR